MAQIVNNFEEEELQQKLMQKYKVKTVEVNQEEKEVQVTRFENLEVADYDTDPLFKNPLLYKDPFPLLGD